MATVLIVDDNLDMRRVLARLVRVSGHNADVAVGGHEAIDYLRSHLPDMVILDVMMPNIDGLDVLRFVRKNPRTQKLPVVMFTAAGDGELRDHALRQGASGYWVKGALDLSQFNTHLETYLNRAN